MLIAFAIFAVSGFCGILLETILLKELTYVFGVTAYAASAVLVAFLGGFALGSAWSGRVRRWKESALAGYGLLELAVGLSGLLSLALLRGASAVYPRLIHLISDSPSSTALVLVRFAFAVPLAGLPAFFMGGTFPLFSQWIARVSGPHRSRISVAYGLNAVGGALGAVIGSYVLIYRFGLSGTALLAASMNALIFCVAWLLQRSEVGRSVAPVVDTGALDPAAEIPPRLALCAAFVTGMLSFAYELVWFHTLSAIVGNTVYAFAVMLCAFLLAIGASGIFAAWILRRAELWRTMLPASALLAGMVVLISSPLWDRLVGVFLWVGDHRPSFIQMEATRFVVCLALTFGPAFFATLTFPLLFTLSRPDDPALRISKLYAINTIGGILGAIGAPFLLLAYLGSERSLECLALLEAALGLALLYRVAPHRFSGWAAATAVVMFAGIAGVPRWDLDRLTSGNYVWFTDGQDRGHTIFFHEDALGGITTISEKQGIRTLKSNGKFQGDNSQEMRAQEAMVRVPLLYVGETHRALLIGLGTGHSLSTLLGYGFEDVDVAEIAPGIIAASPYFETINHGALEDPRVHVHVEDGRNMLMLSDQRYDLISMEITSIWVAGEANVYSKQAYELCRDHLRPDGVLQQWVQMHHATAENVARSLRTMGSVFPHVALFMTGNQGIAVASMAPLLVRADPVVREHLARGERTEIEPLGSAFLDEAAVGRFLADALKTNPRHPISTDDDPILEYDSPYGNSVTGESYSANQRRLEPYAALTMPPTPSGFDHRSQDLIWATFYRSRKPVITDQLLHRSLAPLRYSSE
jgi:spermidine synthase